MRQFVLLLSISHHFEPSTSCRKPCPPLSFLPAWRYPSRLEEEKKLNLDIQASFSMERHITQYQLSKQVLDLKPLYLEMKMMSRYVKNSSKFAYILLARQCRYPTNSRFVIIFLKNLLGHSVLSHKSIHRIPISKKQSCL